MRIRRVSRVDLDVVLEAASLIDHGAAQFVSNNRGPVTATESEPGVAGQLYEWSDVNGYDHQEIRGKWPRCMMAPRHHIVHAARAAHSQLGRRLLDRWWLAWPQAWCRRSRSGRAHLDCEIRAQEASSGFNRAVRRRRVAYLFGPYFQRLGMTEH